MHCPQLATPEQFATLRGYLSQCCFTEDKIRERLDLKSPEDLDLSPLTADPPPERKAADSLDALIFLFILGQFLPTEDALCFFPGAMRESMAQAGLVVVDPADTSRCFATAALYPIRDLFIASDRWNNPDHSPRAPFPEIVYPSLTRGAREYLDLMSFEPCSGFLEICAGAGAAALLAARNTSEVWAADISERAMQFARFNAALNGITGVNFVQGDLFQPVAGRTFERIAAHPPYMPVLQQAEIYYAGGEDGEQITRRIVADLPAYLRPGGRLYSRILGTDRPGKNFEQRLREWLGDKEAEFDVALFVLKTVEPRSFALEETVRKRGGKEELKRWLDMFAKHQIEVLLTGMFVIQRVKAKRPVFTIRRVLPKTTTREAVEWVLGWETEKLENGVEERILRSRPQATPGLDVSTRYGLRDGEVAMEECSISTEKPFPMSSKAQPWMGLLLARCDGKTSVEELFRIAKENEWIKAATPMAEFSRLLATFVSGGFLQI